MNQLIPLRKMPSQTIYDKLTSNYFHYDTKVEIPEVLAPEGYWKISENARSHLCRRPSSGSKADSPRWMALCPYRAHSNH
jgi:hypothetical protein